MSFTFKTQILQNDSSTLMWHWLLIVPPDVVKHFEKTDKRIICTINETPPFHAALMPQGDGNYAILVNQERRKKLGSQLDNDFTVTIEKDTSEYGIAVPEAFTELCYQDPEASALFHKLTPGKQRALLHVMGKPKSEQKQLEKVLIVFDYLKSVNGELDFKELNLAFKNSRFKL